MSILITIMSIGCAILSLLGIAKLYPFFDGLLSFICFGTFGLSCWFACRDIWHESEEGPLMVEDKIFKPYIAEEKKEIEDMVPIARAVPKKKLAKAVKKSKLEMLSEKPAAE